MLVIDERAANHSDCQGYFDGSLELLRELAVTNNVDAALPRLSAIVSKMLPHDALRMACFDQRGRPVVNAWTADVPDMMTSAGEDVIIDDLRTNALGAPAAPHATERLVGAGYRSVLGVSTRAPEPLVLNVAFWSKQPLAFNRTHVPLARLIAYHLSLRRRAHRHGPSDSAIRQVAPHRHDRSQGRRTHHHYQGLEGLPRQQNEGGTATGIDSHAAAPSDSKVPTRGSCHCVMAR